MREGRQLVRALSEFASERRGRSWWCFWSTLAVFLGLLVVAGTGLPWPLRVAASLLAALVHVRFFAIYHDHLHGAILERSRLAGAIFRAYGLLTLAPWTIWKHSHDHHHINNSRRTGVESLGSYPILTVKEYRQASRGTRLLYVLSRHPGTILAGYVSVFFYGFCVRPLIRNGRHHWDAALAIIAHGCALGFLAVLAWDALLLVAIVPSLGASALGSYLFYAQHNFPGVKLRTGGAWDYVNAALRSSSYLRTGRFLRWCTGNIGYHHIHHLNSRIPFYRLPETMAAVPELQCPGTTTLRPADIRRCFGVNLWDPDLDRAVSYREAQAGTGSPAPPPATEAAAPKRS